METPPVHPELAGPDLSVDTGTGAGRVFLWIEHVLLIVAAALTLVAVGTEIVSVYERGRVELADILLMFLYTEVIGMIAVFYTGKSSFFVFPIFIAITALARLIVLQSKDMAPRTSSSKRAQSCCCRSQRW